jgi:ribosomal protein S18 acetylase RimI-like enzyme
MKLEKTPFLATHLTDDVAWIDVLFVPKEQRHQGFGRRMVLQWLSRLPATIKKIELLAVDLDGGSPVGFWKKMGFDVEDKYFPELMTGCYMSHPLHDDGQTQKEPQDHEEKPHADDDVWCVQA